MKKTHLEPKKKLDHILEDLNYLNGDYFQSEFSLFKMYRYFYKKFIPL